MRPEDVLLPAGLPVWERLAPHFTRWGVVDTRTTLVLAVGCNILGLLEEGAAQGRTIPPDTLAEVRAVARDMGLPLELVAPWAVRGGP